MQIQRFEKNIKISSFYIKVRIAATLFSHLNVTIVKAIFTTQFLHRKDRICMRKIGDRTKKKKYLYRYTSFQITDATINNSSVEDGKREKFFEASAGSRIYVLRTRIPKRE